MAWKQLSEMKLFRYHLDGMCATYVDDLLQAGTKKFHEESKKTEQTLQCKKREYGRIQFAGSQIDVAANGFEVHQKNCTFKLPFITPNRTYNNFRSLRAILARSINIRPEVAFKITQSTQVTEKRFNFDVEGHRKALHSIVLQLKKTRGLNLKFPKLDKSSLHLRVYSNASFANNYDKFSQSGYIIFMADKENACQPLCWSSQKSKRVTRSVLGSETMAFADAFDMAFVIKHDLQRMINNIVPIQHCSYYHADRQPFPISCHHPSFKNCRKTAYDRSTYSQRCLSSQIN